MTKHGTDESAQMTKLGRDESAHRSSYHCVTDHEGTSPSTSARLARHQHPCCNSAPPASLVATV